MHQGSKNNLLSLGYTPVKSEELNKYCYFYPYKSDAEILRSGFSTGFRINYLGSVAPQISKNLKSAYLHSKELKEKIMKEISLGRIAGPFKKPPFKQFKVSPVGLVPKNDGTWRLITHLSYPEGGSVNDGIDKQLCSVSYTSFDQVAQLVFKSGKGALMAKRDVKSAFRLLPVCPNDFHLLGIHIEDDYFFDKMLPMGLSLSCSLFEKFATFLHWLVSFKSGISSLDHYLDDFIFVGEKGTGDCEKLVSTFAATCQEIGVPIADEKSVGPTTVLVFLGIEIDSVEMKIRIPLQKIEELKVLLSSYVNKKKVTLKELQKLTGKLSFFCRAVRSSRAFLRRFYDAMAGLKKPFHHLRVSNELKQDLEMWLLFLEEFNGTLYIPDDIWLSSDTLQLFTDSAGSPHLGCACFLSGSWAFMQWPEHWAKKEKFYDMAFLEMVPVILAVTLWGKKIAGRKILFFIDNEALVRVLNKQTAKSRSLMFLVRKFVLLCMKLDVLFKAVHITSKCNGIADSLSRMQWQRFRRLAPEAEVDPEPIPIHFQSMICNMRLQD